MINVKTSTFQTALFIMISNPDDILTGHVHPKTPRGTGIVRQDDI